MPVLRAGFGKAHVFYPEATAERCTAALLLDVDPVGLVRGEGETQRPLEQYVNDRPYVASSFLSVAIAQVYRLGAGGSEQGAAGAGRHAHPVDREIRGAALPGRRGLPGALFEPLGYTMASDAPSARREVPRLGREPVLHGRPGRPPTLSDLLTHLYVLIPVLDDDKHYWVGDDEVEKLLPKGAGWLAAHPEREAIAHRYLKHQPASPGRRSRGLSTRKTSPRSDEPTGPAQDDEVRWNAGSA